MALLRFVRGIERAALVGVFLAMTAMYTANVLVREFGGTLASDFAWIEEAVRTLNLYLVFGALGLALEHGRQVVVDAWRDSIAARTGLPLRKVIDLAGLAFSLFLCWLSIRMAVFVAGSGQHSPTLGISAAWIYVAPAIGFALLALRYGLSLAGAIERFAITGPETAP